MAPIAKKWSEFPTSWAAAAIRTMHASRWEILKARMFGRRFTGEDMGHTIIGHEYRGKFYLTDYRVNHLFARLARLWLRLAQHLIHTEYPCHPVV